MCTPSIFGKILTAAWMLLASGCVSSAIYHPSSTIGHTPAAASLAYEDVSFTAQDGVTLSGWWIPSENPRGTVLFCHGNGGNISSYLDSARIINELKLNALLFDYRGYGRSSGRPSEQGTYADADAAWDYLVNVRKVPPRKVILWGRSLGGPIAAWTAARHPAGAVIMESTFTSLPDLVADRFSWVPSWLFRNYAYDTRLYLEKVGAPVLVIHSPDDEVVPFAHSKRLYDSIKSPKVFLQIKGSHNRGFVLSRNELEASINEFIAGRIERPGEAAQ
jgi:uncharacterized protein